MQIISYNLEQTQKYAKHLASLCTGGELLCLIGDLGAGKTAFTQGFARGLQIARPVTSPTFVLMQVHDGKTVSGKKIKLYHMDAYRLSSNEEALDLGLAEIWSDDSSVMVIEWADRIAGVLPENRLEIYMTHSEGERGLGELSDTEKSTKK